MWCTMQSFSKKDCLSFAWKCTSSEREAFSLPPHCLLTITRDQSLTVIALDFSLGTIFILLCQNFITKNRPKFFLSDHISHSGQERAVYIHVVKLSPIKMWFDLFFLFFPQLYLLGWLREYFHPVQFWGQWSKLFLFYPK